MCINSEDKMRIYERALLTLVRVVIFPCCKRWILNNFMLENIHRVLYIWFLPRKESKYGLKFSVLNYMFLLLFSILASLNMFCVYIYKLSTCTSTVNHVGCLFKVRTSTAVTSEYWIVKYNTYFCITNWFSFTTFTVAMFCSCFKLIN